jgi:uncharacterized protein (UPF0303 family)
MNYFACQRYSKPSWIPRPAEVVRRVHSSLARMGMELRSHARLVAGKDKALQEFMDLNSSWVREDVHLCPRFQWN